eukprot:2357969-Pyramimonas_sp.AAC.1
MESATQQTRGARGTAHRQRLFLATHMGNVSLWPCIPKRHGGTASRDGKKPDEGPSLVDDLKPLAATCQHALSEAVSSLNE